MCAALEDDGAVPHSSNTNPSGNPLCDYMKTKDNDNSNSNLEATFALMQSFMLQKGLLDNKMTEREIKEFLQKETSKKTIDQHDKGDASSEITLYKRAVPINSGREISFNPELDQQIDQLLNQTRLQAGEKHNTSSSSEDFIDTSDENIQVDNNSQYISDMTEKTQPKPATPKRVANNLSTEGNAAKMIQEAEKARATMFEVPGKYNTSQIDEDYQMIDSHLDDSLKHKIQAFEYVDFARLISKNKSLRDEEGQRLEIVNKNGMSFLSPVAEGNITINSYGKWEQAFRVYSNVLTTKFPAKSTELLQYNHTIHSASSTYVWDNVYAYDKEFCHHIARHPYRSWGVILQQA